MRKLVVAALGFTALVAACGGGTTGKNGASSSSDIAIPGAPNAESKLLWHEDARIVLGTCPAGGLPARANCRRTSMVPFESFQSQIEGSLQAETKAKDTAYNDELMKLRNAHPDVVAAKSTLAAAKHDGEILKTRATGYTRQIAKEQQQIDAVDTSVKSYDAQIVAVRERLAGSPGNADLTRLLDTLQQERAAALVRKGELEEQKKGHEAKLAEVNTQVEAKEAEIAAQDAVVKDLLSRVEVDSPDLGRLRTEAETMRLVRDRLPTILAYVRESSFSYRYDLLDEPNKALIDRIVATMTALEGGIKLQGEFKPTLILHEGEWRAICDDGFGQEEAEVVCRMLGKKAKVYHSEMTNAGGKYWLSNLRCTGTERSLSECPANPWGVHTCGWSEAVSVECE